MEQDRFEAIKYRLDNRYNFGYIEYPGLVYSDVDYLIKEVERLRALLANYDDNYCKVWHIGDVLGDK